MYDNSSRNESVVQTPIWSGEPAADHKRRRVTVAERELIEADPNTDNGVLTYRPQPRLVFADTVVL